MDRLAVYRNGERIPDLGTVALDALADRDELVELTIANDTGKPAQNVRVVSDLPDGAFSAQVPRTIPAGGAATALLTFRTARIFDDDDVTKINLRLEYDLVKVIED